MIELEYIFSVLVDLAKEYNIDIYLLNKSKYPIRNNVSMTIDLDEYDTTTDFEVVKDLQILKEKFKYVLVVED